MNTSNFYAGIVVVLAGAILFFAGPYLILIPTVQTQVNSFFDNEAFVVADFWERSVQLDEGILANGTVRVSSALTSDPSQVSMLVLDDVNYQKWVAHSSPTCLFQRDMPDGHTFSFTAPRSGVYHFIFDNANSPVKKNLVVSVDLQRQAVVNLPDERIRYVAYGLLVTGALVAVIGIVRRTQVPWA